GNDVRGVDADGDAIASLAAAVPPVHEPRLNDLLRCNLAAGRLRYFTSFRDALNGAAAAIVAIDTPVSADDRPDVEPVFGAVRSVASAVNADLTLVVSAQVPVGTCDRLLAD